jgi:hypothetical protein
MEMNLKLSLNDDREIGLKFALEHPEGPTPEELLSGVVYNFLDAAYVQYKESMSVTLDEGFATLGKDEQTNVMVITTNLAAAPDDKKAEVNELLAKAAEILGQ